MPLKSDQKVVGNILDTSDQYWHEFVLRWLALLASLLLLTLPLIAASEATLSTDKQETLEVFVRDGCPHCANAKKFLSGFSRKRPSLQIVYRPVDHDPIARNELAWHSQNAGIWPPGVPTFVINGRVLVGFDDAAHTGPMLEALVEQPCRQGGEIQAYLFEHDNK